MEPLDSMATARHGHSAPRRLAPACRHAAGFSWKRTAAETLAAIREAAEG
jgi:hypothetical protein